MNKRQAKIEALKIISGLCSSCDLSMFWDDNDIIQDTNEQTKILHEVNEIGNRLSARADKLERGKR